MEQAGGILQSSNFPKGGASVSFELTAPMDKMKNDELSRTFTIHELSTRYETLIGGNTCQNSVSYRTFLSVSLGSSFTGISK
jgi:hypothetical protein